MKNRKIGLIINPVAGFRRGRRIAKSILRLLRQRGYIVESYETKGPGSAEKYLRENSNEFPLVTCIGGDGTVNEVVNGIRDTKNTIVSFIPAGTSNVFAKEMKLPYDITKLADIVTSGKYVEWDVGVNTVTGRKFVLMASAGFDSIVVNTFLPQRRGVVSQFTYFIWGLSIFPSYKSPKIDVEIDGKIVGKNASLVIVANGGAYGGPLVFTPLARPDDSFFDVFIYKRRKKLDSVWLFGQSFFSSITSTYRIAGSQVVRGRHVRLSSDEPIPLQMDGDPAGFLPAVFEIIPRHIRIAR